MVMNLQWIKDFGAIPIFVWIALTPSVSNSRHLLSLFFAFGCLLDTLFVSFFYWYEKPWTIARVKDVLGAVGMWVFCLVLLAANPAPEVHRWPSFFWLATAIDSMSVLSVFSGNYNWYQFRVVPQIDA